LIQPAGWPTTSFGDGGDRRENLFQRRDNLMVFRLDAEMGKIMLPAMHWTNNGLSPLCLTPAKFFLAVNPQHAFTIYATSLDRPWHYRPVSALHHFRWFLGFKTSVAEHQALLFRRGSTAVACSSASNHCSTSMMP
jgi:hypothetical protein